MYGTDEAFEAETSKQAGMLGFSKCKLVAGRAKLLFQREGLSVEEAVCRARGQVMQSDAADEYARETGAEPLPDEDDQPAPSPDAVLSEKQVSKALQYMRTHEGVTYRAAVKAAVGVDDPSLDQE